MPNIKVVPESYVSIDDVDRVINYVARKAHIFGGLAVDPSHAAEDMRLVKTLYGKTNGKQLRHFILNYSEQESKNIRSAEQLQCIAYHVCTYFADEYQIVFGIHKSNHWHIHFVMNTVNYKTGKKYAGGNKTDWDLACDVCSVLGLKNIQVYYA